MKKTNKHRLLYKLFNAIAHAVDDIGYASTIQVLNNSRTKNDVSYENFTNCVNIVMQVFQISKSELLEGTQKKYPRKYAFGILIYIANTEYGYSLADLGRYLQRDRSNLSRIKNDMALNLESINGRFDEFILGKYQACKQLLNKKEEILQTHD
jgi:hypothetical protein